MYITVTGLSNNHLITIFQDLSNSREVKEENNTVNLLVNHEHHNEAIGSTDHQFRKMIENSTIGIYRITPDGQILMANKTLYELMGFESFQQFSDRNLEHEGFEPGYQCDLFKRTLESKGEVKGLESVWKRRDGSWLEVRENARDEGGR